MNSALRATTCIVFCFLLCATQIGCNRGRQADADARATPKAKVKVANVKADNLKEQVTIPVTVESYEMTALYSRIEGYVGKVNVDIGAEVAGPTYDADGNMTKPGDELIVLNVPELVSEQVRREKMVAKAEADQRSAKETANSIVKEVEQAESRRAAQMKLEKLRTLERNQMARLVQAGNVNREELDKAQFALDVVTEQLKQIDADVAAAEARKLSADAKADAAAVDIEVAEAELRKAKDLADYRFIRAPFDGLITERNVHPGALVQSSDRDKPLLTIENVHKLRLIMYLPYDDATKLNVGDKVMLHSVEGRADKQFPEMTVTRTADSFHRGSRMMRAEVDFDNSSKDPETGRRKLMPGDYGRITLILQEHSLVETVPESALIEKNEDAYVMVADGNTCRRTPVEVVVKDGTKVGIQGKGGASLIGKRVIVSDVARFRDGQTIDGEIEVVEAP